MTFKIFAALSATILSAASLFGQVPAGLAPFFTFLKANSSVQKIATDAQGFIYVYGQTALSEPESSDYNPNVFVARLNPTATALTYMVQLGGSSPTFAGAMAVDAAGNAYLTGYTDAADFPTVPSAPGPTTVNAQVPFVAKVNINGTIVYSTLFSSGVRALPQSIAVDSSGDAIVSGTISGQGYATTAGAYNNAWTINPPFVTKLDPTGTKLAFSAVGVGGSSLVVDSSGNIFIAGTTSGTLAPNATTFYPTTSGAFQTSYTPYTYCIAPCGIGAYDFSAGEQYVTKLSADGSKLLYSTFLTGGVGTYNAGMALDASGNVWVTGYTTYGFTTTAATDYPYTQTSTPTPLTATTFTSELDPTLSKLLLSVPNGVPPGNGSNIWFDPQGNLIEAAAFAPPSSIAVLEPSLNTPVAPSTGNTPTPCLPGGVAAFVFRISSQNGSVLGADVLPMGTQAGESYASAPLSSAVDAQGNIYVGGSSQLPDVPLTPGVVYDPAVTERTVSGAFLERIDATVSASPVACVTDAATMSLLGPVAPGQLIALLGNGIGPSQPVNGLTSGASSVPTSLGGVSVTFDNQPAPILYASATQINIQVPFEIKQKAASSGNPQSTVMEVSYNGSVIETRSFAVVAAAPSLFISFAGVPVCGNSQLANQSEAVALALNQDGSVNSCTNPAPAGSTFTLFVNGIGTFAEDETTGGLVASNPGLEYSSVALFNNEYSVEVDAFTDTPNGISGTGTIMARVPDTITAPQALNLTLTFNGLPAGPLMPGPGAGSSATSLEVAVFVGPPSATGNALRASHRGM